MSISRPRSPTAEADAAFDSVLSTFEALLKSNETSVASSTEGDERTRVIVTKMQATFEAKLNQLTFQAIHLERRLQALIHMKDQRIEALNKELEDKQQQIVELNDRLNFKEFEVKSLSRTVIQLESENFK